MGVIFTASADSASAQRGSRIIGPLVRWLMPNISAENLDATVYWVRKLAHVSEYAVLAILLWRAWRGPAKGQTRRWRWSEAGFALAVAGVYCVTDEVHQAFVPTRVASGVDVVIDLAGAALGLLALWALGRWWKRW